MRSYGARDVILTVPRNGHYRIVHFYRPGEITSIVVRLVHHEMNVVHSRVNELHGFCYPVINIYVFVESSFQRPRDRYLGQIIAHLTVSVFLRHKSYETGSVAFVHSFRKTLDCL